ncbi:MAG TPA: acyltransferase, partial [Gaiellaceae bacterium]
MKRRDDLQGLRAVAVLVVALGHAGVGFLGGGYVGVDVFFVLSGFLITGLLLDEARRTGAVSLAGFYTRRARRILPAAALTLVATELAAYVLLNFVRARQVMWDSVWAAFFGANVHFSRIETDYFARDRPPSPIQHFWTLAVEEQFYLVWPALLGLVLFGVLLLRRRRGAVTPASTRRLLAVLLLATAASLAWS